ncbi:MAG TPA: hypothetical protein PK776_09390 [Flavobacterium sp.]|nr:hypothetical protein [Flavobacterium sp.]
MRTNKEYAIAIKAKYEKEKNGQYAVFLSDLKRGSLKELCLNLLIQGMSDKDKNVFANFFSFKLEDSIKSQQKAIEDFNLDGFRKVVYFLSREKEEIKNPNSKVLELSAILVDFNPRPYSAFLNTRKEDTDEDIPPKKNTADVNDLNDSEKESDDLPNIDPEDTVPDNISEEKTEKEEKTFEIEEQSGETEPTNTEGDGNQNSEDGNTIQDSIPMGFLQPPTQGNKPPPNVGPIVRFFKKRQLSKIHYGLATVMIMVLVVWSLNKTIFTPKNCMVWMEDHYEKMDCNDPEINGEIQPLDEQLLEHFRKVAYSDTLTCFDLYGNPLIWYSKTNGYYELFTHHGLHPVTGKTLKPITETIRNNLNSDPNQ